MLPVIPMASLPTVVRSANEECTNALQAKPQYRSLTEVVIENGLPIATITCRRSPKGVITVSIKMAPQGDTTAEAAPTGDVRF